MSEGIPQQGEDPNQQQWDANAQAAYFEGWTQEQIQQYYAQYYASQGYDYSQQGYSYGAMDPASMYSGYGAQDPYSMYGGYSSMGMSSGPMSSGKGEPTKSIWLGNVDPQTSDNDLQSMVSRFGPIESVKILPAKNCAFVKFADIDAAIAAHSALQGAILHGQHLKVGWGKPEPTPRDDLGPPPCRNLWLGNIGPEVNEEIIRSHFGQFGVIDKVRLLPAKNCAFVNFASLESAVRSKQHMQGAMIAGRSIKINYGKENNDLFGDLLSDKLKNIEPPPPEAYPPDDYQIANVIDKLAEFVKKNGPQFESMTKEKQKENPKFGFLDAEHPHNPYYKWKLWKLRNPDVDDKTIAQLRNQKPGTPYGAVPPPESDSFGYILRQASQAQQAARAAQGISSPPRQQEREPRYRDRSPPTSPNKTTETIKQLASLIDSLSPTKDSIKVTKNWIMQQPINYIKDVASYIRTRVERDQDFEKKLNIIYLIHDILYHTFRNRQNPNDLDDYARAFEPHLGFILRSGFENQAPELQEKVFKVFKLWEEKKIFEEKILKRMDDEMRGRFDAREREQREREARNKNRDSYDDRDRNDRDSRDRSYRGGGGDRDRDRRKRSRSRDRDRESKRRH